MMTQSINAFADVVCNCAFEKTYDEYGLNINVRLIDVIVFDFIRLINPHWEINNEIKAVGFMVFIELGDVLSGQFTTEIV